MGSLHGNSPGNGVNNTGGGNGNGGGGVSAPVVMMNTLRGVSEGLLAPGVSSPHRVTRAQLKADRPGGPATPSRAGEVVRAQTTPTPARLATTPETQRKTRRSAAAASGATAAETHDEALATFAAAEEAAETGNDKTSPENNAGVGLPDKAQNDVDLDIDDEAMNAVNGGINDGEDNNYLGEVALDVGMEQPRLPSSWPKRLRTEAPPPPQPNGYSPSKARAKDAAHGFSLGPAIVGAARPPQATARIRSPPKPGSSKKRPPSVVPVPPPPARTNGTSGANRSRPKKRKAPNNDFSFPSPDAANVLAEDTLFADFAHQAGAGDAMDMALPLDAFALDLDRPPMPLNAAPRGGSNAAARRRNRGGGRGDNRWPGFMPSKSDPRRLDPRALREHIDTLARAFGPEHAHVGKAWLLLARLYHMRGEQLNAAEAIRHSMSVFHTLAPATIEADASSGCEMAFEALLHSTSVPDTSNGHRHQHRRTTHHTNPHHGTAGHDDDAMGNPIIRGALVREVRASHDHVGPRPPHLVVVGHSLGIPTSGAPTPDAGPPDVHGELGLPGMFVDLFGSESPTRGGMRVHIPEDGDGVGVNLPSPLPSPGMIGLPIKA